MKLKKGCKKCLALAGMVSTVVCFICDLVGLVTDEWQTREDADFNNSSKAGLWTCTNEMCDRDEGGMMASQACGVIGALMMVACMVVEIAMMMSKDFRKKGIWIFIAMNVLGLVLIVTECAMYVDTTSMEPGEFGYSSILTILAFLLSFLGMICCVVAQCDEIKCRQTDTSASYIDVPMTER